MISQSPVAPETSLLGSGVRVSMMLMAVLSCAVKEAAFASAKQGARQAERLIEIKVARHGAGKIDVSTPGDRRHGPA